MNSWAIKNLNLKPHAPEILASTDDARAIALLIPAGESLDDHQVHERAWVTVLDGEVEITTTTGESRQRQQRPAHRIRSQRAPCRTRPHRRPTLAAAHAMARTRPSRSDGT